MTSSSISNPSQDNHTHLLCWRSIFSGILVTAFVYMVFSAFGAGIGGITAAHIIDKNENGSALAAGAGLWLGISAAISLFLGSYFATRYSTALSSKVGAAQGVFISAVFFLLLLHGTGNFLGNLSDITANLSTPTQLDAQEAARAIGDTGWLLFVTFIVGAAAAIFGGYEGALGNRKRPYSRSRSL